MTKNEWQKEYEILDKFYSDFNEAYPDYKNGRNKAVRNAAERKFNSAITLTKLRIEKNPEVLGLFANSEFGHPFAYDEFYQARYFGGDMSRFLKMIREKIESLSS